MFFHVQTCRLVFPSIVKKISRAKIVRDRSMLLSLAFCLSCDFAFYMEETYTIVKKTTYDILFPT
jgi:hypothetical protein